MSMSICRSAPLLCLFAVTHCSAHSAGADCSIDQQCSSLPGKLEIAPSLIQRDRIVPSAPGERQLCDLRSEQDCHSGPGFSRGLCKWRHDLKKCTARIAWFHPMKTGSTFGATLAHFANHTIPRNAHMPSCGYIDQTPEDACPAGQQGPYEFFVYKYPYQKYFESVFWNNKDDQDPGNHRSISSLAWRMWHGRFVGIFRQPESRSASAFNHFTGGAGDVRQWSMYTQGTVTKMLAGVNGGTVMNCSFLYNKTFRHDCSSAECQECRTPAEKHLPLALERLKGFAFVGLMEQYAFSVCLFHKMFGGECLPIEFVNMRKGVVHQDPAVLLAKLHGFEDSADNAVYDAVKQRFEAEVLRFNVNKATCAKMCPGTDAFH
eukprot:TRINITY_DN77058_c0_g1_i1.p1 TRINITY_DN77058_c0_g1~~TRINITY_DN77058_c0_g1_i1.p1  ORF type:complete len:375 (+),score=50.04 TRINITY_DN77058_c0_g1_i1:34-1158(+)